MGADTIFREGQILHTLPASLSKRSFSPSTDRPLSSASGHSFGFSPLPPPPPPPALTGREQLGDGRWDGRYENICVAVSAGRCSWGREDGGRDRSEGCRRRLSDPVAGDSCRAKEGWRSSERSGLGFMAQDPGAGGQRWRRERQMVSLTMVVFPVFYTHTLSHTHFPYLDSFLLFSSFSSLWSWKKRVLFAWDCK